MADSKPILYGPDNRPIDRSLLKQEIAAATITGVRSPLSGYPGDGLNPRGLTSILRAADAGDPLRYLELAEQIEERDAHYAGVLATRKRSVAQLEIVVDSASDDPDDVTNADMLREWLRLGILRGALFDILDAIGKGWSFVEIIWDSSEGQWQPAKLEWRDPRSFRPDPIDLATPLLRVDAGSPLFDGIDGRYRGLGAVPLPGFQFVHAVMKAKSGLPLRSGIARLAAWSWMFKAFTSRDWQIFIQTYGPPIRIGRYGPGASEQDKDTLFNAVANIAGDCAAIVPAGMDIEFVESKNVAAGADLYKQRADWLDQQISKAVLGQTATTDAIAGGHAVGKEHRQVQKDIEDDDAKSLSSILNRDLARPFVDLNRGPQRRYPELRVVSKDDTDIAQLTSSVERLVPFGLRVGKSWMNDKLGIPDPGKTEELLVAPAGYTPPAVSSLLPPPLAGEGRGGGIQPALNAVRRSVAAQESDDADRLATAADILSQPGADALIDTVRQLVETAPDLNAVRAGILKLKPDMPKTELAGAMQMAMAMAMLAGRAEIAEQG